MKRVKVRGFSRDNTGRMLRRGGMDRFDCPGYLQENVELDCLVQFGKVLMRFDDTLQNRPYLQFVEGRMRGATVDLSDMPELPWDEADVDFDDRSMPEINMRWDLNNAELAALVKKGLFGFDYDIDHKDGVQPKPERRGPIEMPPLLTASPIEIPINCDIRALAVHSEELKQTVPVIGVYPKDALDLRVNTRIIGYGDSMDSYFAEPSFLMPNEYEDSGKEEDMIYLRDEEKLFMPKVSEVSADVRTREAETAKDPVYRFSVEEEKMLDLVAENRSAREIAAIEKQVDDIVKQAGESMEEALEQWRRSVTKDVPDAEKEAVPAFSASEKADQAYRNMEEKEGETEDDMYFRDGLQ